MLQKKLALFVLVLGLITFLAACIDAGGDVSELLSSDQSSFIQSNIDSSEEAESSDESSYGESLPSTQESSQSSQESSEESSQTTTVEPSSQEESSGPESSSPPVESSSPPVESSSPPVESSKPPVESSKPPVESSKPPVESSKPPVESSKPPVESSKPPVESSKPPVESSKPPVESSKPPVESSKPPVESSTPPTSSEEESVLPPYQIKVPVASGTSTFEKNSVIIDYSNISQGYVMIKTPNNTSRTYRAIITLQSTNEKYYYLLNNTGNYDTLPISRGNGSYKIQVMFMYTETKMQELASVTVNVALADPNISFLYPSTIVSFNANSAAVKKANELCAKAKNQADIVNAVFNYIADNIKYDYDKAANLPSSYIPSPDNTLATKKGICSDYASLMAAMLRSQGIPTRYVVGDVLQGGQYYRHAWNEIYLNGKWTIIGVYFDGVTWKMADMTFAAGLDFGDYVEFISIGNNYTSITKE